MLGSLSFLNLAAFSLLALAPLLILAYLKRRPQKQQLVSSTLILKRLPHKVALRTRVKLPLRFFLELCALLLFTGAAAWPILNDDATGVAVIFDNSLSMNASVESSVRRIDKARALFRNAISDEVTYVYTLYSTAPKLNQVTDDRISEGELLAALDRLEPFPATDSLSVMVDELARSGNYERVIVVSDEQGESQRVTSAEQDSLDKSSKTTTAVASISLAEQAGNYYLANIDYETRSKTEAFVKASVGLSASTQAALNVRLLGGTLKDNTISLRELGTKNIRLEPHLVGQVSFDVSPSASLSIFKLEVSADQAVQNALSEDDTAWLSTLSLTQTKVLVVSPVSSDNALGLGSLSGLALTHETPQTFAERPDSSLKDFSLLIFHRTAPRSAPLVPSLFVLPPENNSIFPAEGSYENIKVSSWADDHPITSYLRVPLLSPSQAALFNVPLWAHSIINSENGSIVVAGESRGIRFAGIGFELFPFEGRKTPVSSVLTLNLISWLTGGGTLEGQLVTGSNLRLESGSRWNISSPSGTNEEITPTDNEPTFFPLAERGIYVVEEQKAVSGEKSTKLVAVNSFFPDESTTAIPHVFSSPTTLPHTEVTFRKTQKDYWPILIMIAAVMLLADVILRTFGSEKFASGVPGGNK